MENVSMLIVMLVISSSCNDLSPELLIAQLFLTHLIF